MTGRLKAETEASEVELSVGLDWVAADALWLVVRAVLCRTSQ